MPTGVYKRDKETKDRLRSLRTGCKNSDIQNKKIGDSHKGNKYNVGKRRPMSFRYKISEGNKGEKSHFWNGGVTKQNEKERKGIEYRLWREAVFARDNWICQKTGNRGGNLHPHHIKNFSEYPELRFAIDNGVTLSEEAHKEFHFIYGTKGNNKEQLNDWIR